MGEVVQDNACSSAVACVACSPTMDLCAVAQQSGALQIYVRAFARGRALEFTRAVAAGHALGASRVARGCGDHRIHDRSMLASRRCVARRARGVMQPACDHARAGTLIAAGGASGAICVVATETVRAHCERTDRLLTGLCSLSQGELQWELSVFDAVAVTTMVWTRCGPAQRARGRSGVPR